MNPFLINGYISPDYFCDRDPETKVLLSNIRQQTNTAFFAQRRIGKTALIRHVFYHLQKKKTNCIYLDLYATRSLKDFSDQLATSIYSQFPPNKSAGKRFMEAIRLLRPVLSFDEFTSQPQLTLDITRPRQIESTVPQLLRFLDAQKIHTVLAFDEFQQVLSYQEQNVEAMLRGVIQELRHINFIFCGSNQELMGQIFNSSKRPFYASTKNIHLQRIAAEPYSKFICGHFSKKAQISEQAVELLLELSDRQT